jgi:hypothetical protein
MLNLLFSPSIAIGVSIILSVLVLYFLRTVRYDLSRDVDVFFTTLGLFYSSILIVHGWRMDPILLFSQILLVALLFGIGWENIRLRGVVSKQLEFLEEQGKALDETLDDLKCLDEGLEEKDKLLDELPKEKTFLERILPKKKSILERVNTQIRFGYLEIDTRNDPTRDDPYDDCI